MQHKCSVGRFGAARDLKNTLKINVIHKSLQIFNYFIIWYNKKPENFPYTLLKKMWVDIKDQTVIFYKENWPKLHYRYIQNSHISIIPTVTYYYRSKMNWMYFILLFTNNLMMRWYPNIYKWHTCFKSKYGYPCTYYV